MQFLSPWTALLAAAVALPLLLLLYFLKLRRQSLRIPSTLLWQKSFEDLQVNAPFQRLRWSVLLALQLLMLIALLLALAEPLWRGSWGDGSPARVVLLIDRSASMNAPASEQAADSPANPPVTRFAAAQRAAIDIIDTLGERGGPTQIMLIAFGSRAQVISTFESNRGVLRDAVNALTPTDEQANLAAALELASAFAGSREESGEGDQPPRVVLLSDGNVSAGDGGSANAGDAFSLRGGDFEFIQVAGASASPIDNLGIVALGARRDYDDPARVVIFARLLNAGPAALDPILTLSIDGRPATTLRASVPPAAENALAGETSVSYALDMPGGGMVALAHNHRDQLAADDVAATVVPPPNRPRIALVHPDDAAPDPYLRELLEAMEPQRVDAIVAGDWSRADAARIDSGADYDVVVFDRVSGQRLPGVPSLTFGGVPAGLDAIAPDDDRGRAIMSWDRQHPVMRNLSLDSIVFSGFGAIELPETTATPLAWGAQGPIIALLRTRDARHVVVGFAPAKSNWPLHVSSAMFVQNALEFLTLAGGNDRGGAGGGGVGTAGSGLVHRPGEAIRVRAEPDANAIALSDGRTTIEIPIADARDDAAVPTTQPALDSARPRSVTLPALPRVGVFAARGAMPPHQWIAVSMLSDVESDIRLRDALTVNAQASEALAGERDLPLPLWPWLLGAAFVLAIIEWLAYCRRVR